MSNPNEPVRRVPADHADPADPAGAILAVHEALAAFDPPGGLRRADVLADHARTLVAASGELSALGVDERVLRSLAIAVRQLHRAQRASTAHRVNWFTRPLATFASRCPPAWPVGR